MIDPITLTQLIAAIAQLLQMGAQGIDALSNLFPEFDRFWEVFEAQLRDDERISMADLDAVGYREPEFHALVIPFIGGDAEARREIEKRIRAVVADDLVGADECC